MKYTKNGFFAVFALALVAGCGGSGNTPIPPPPPIIEPPEQVLRGNGDFALDPATGIATIGTGNTAYTVNASTSPNGNFIGDPTGIGYYSVSSGNPQVSAIAVSTNGRSVAENGYAISRAIIPVTVPTGGANYEARYKGILQSDLNNGTAAEVQNYVEGIANFSLDFPTGQLAGQITDRTLRTPNGIPVFQVVAPISIQGTYDAETLAVRGTTRGGGITGVTNGLEGTTDIMLGGATGREMIGGLGFQHVSTDPTNPQRWNETGVFRGDAQ